MTVARGLNMERPKDYARLLESAEPDFVEVKAYMHLGRSRTRLDREAMPDHAEVLSFARAQTVKSQGKPGADIPYTTGYGLRV